jgi:TonB-dependent starch-binding outer membrane protein SusC
MNKLKNSCLLIILLISIPFNLLAQTIIIKGTVKDTKEAIMGATVAVKGTTNATVTDVDGNYSIKIPTTVKQLTVSFVGYETKTIAIGNQTTIDVTLNESSQMLDEVVAIGYAKVQRKDLTGSTVSVLGSDLAIAPVTTAAQALSGKAAGVNIVTQSGAPGASINITVRGGTSITQSTTPLYIVDGFKMDDGLQNVDINDIESIDIMKDASATAIYGAQGSNGVILITTKSAKEGKTQVNYNSYLSFEKLGKKLDVLNVLDYVKYQYEFQVLQGKESSWSSMFDNSKDTSSSDFYTGAYDRINSEYASRDGIDWQNLVFGGTGLTQNHNLSVTGGNEKTKYMLSYNYTGQDGIMKKHGYDKNSIRLKLNHELYKGVRSDFNINFNNTEIDGGGSLGGALKNTILQPPTGGTRYTNNELINTDLTDDMLALDSQYDTSNPLITNDAVTQKKITRQFIVNADIEFDITKDIMFRTGGSYTWNQTREDYWDDGRTQTAINAGGPYGSRDNSESYSYELTNTLNWGHNFNNHKINLLLGQEISYSNSQSLDNTYKDFPSDNFGLNDVSIAGSVEYSSSKSRTSMSSFFGRGSYNYKDRYLVNATFRADGSSKFAKDNRWGFFPSGSAAWRISQESFMANQTFFDNLKLRIGYGTTGNCNISNNMYATDYSSGHYAIDNSDYATLIPGSTLGNNKLKWETAVSTNLGLDMSFFKNHVNLSIDVYNNKSKDLLIKNTIPTSTGYSYQYQNIGSVRNRGLELVMNTVNIKNRKFKWNTDFNISMNRSKVLALHGTGSDDYMLQNVSSRIDYMIKVGQPLGQFYGYKYDGVYTTDDFTQNGDGSYTLNNGVARLSGATVANIKPGDVKYVCTAGNTDSNGNPIWSTSDRTVLGNAQPKFQGGINNTFVYKGFDLTIFANFVVGNKVFNMSSQRFIGPYLANQNTLSVMKDRFTLIDPSTGQESTSLSTLASLNPQQYSKDAMWSLNSNNKIAVTDALDYYLEDGSFLRIGQIVLGYSLPKSWLQRVKINTAHIYLTLNNVYTFTKYSGYDPEVSSTSSQLTAGIDNSSYPRSKSYVIGINLSF